MSNEIIRLHRIALDSTADISDCITHAAFLLPATGPLSKIRFVLSRAIINISLPTLSSTIKANAGRYWRILPICSLVITKYRRVAPIIMWHNWMLIDFAVLLRR